MKKLCKKSHGAILLLRGVQLWPSVVMICHQSQERHEYIPLKPPSIILILSAEDATRCLISNRLNGVIRSKSGHNNRSATRDISEDPVRHCKSGWRHEMEIFSALLVICAGNSPVPGEFPAQRPVTRSFDVFFDLRLNKQLSKQSCGWWFETPSRPLWRHRNGCHAVTERLFAFTIGRENGYEAFWKSALCLFVAYHPK